MEKAHKYKNKISSQDEPIEDEYSYSEFYDSYLEEEGDEMAFYFSKQLQGKQSKRNRTERSRKKSTNHSQKYLLRDWQDTDYGAGKSANDDWF